MQSSSIQRASARVLSALLLVMLLLGCAGNREYAHYRWKGKYPHKHSAEAKATPVRLQDPSSESFIEPKGARQPNAASHVPKTSDIIETPSESLATVKRPAISAPTRSLHGLQPHRITNPMDVALQSLKEQQVSALEAKQLAKDSLLWWGLLLCGVGLILLLLAGILGAGNGFILTWLFWVLGSIALVGGLILLLVHLLNML